MKYLKTFESNFNFDIGVFTIKEASKLYQKINMIMNMT